MEVFFSFFFERNRKNSRVCKNIIYDKSIAILKNNVSLLICNNPLKLAVRFCFLSLKPELNKKNSKNPNLNVQSLTKLQRRKIFRGSLQ